MGEMPHWYCSEDAKDETDDEEEEDNEEEVCNLCTGVFLKVDGGCKVDDCEMEVECGE